MKDKSAEILKIRVIRVLIRYLTTLSLFVSKDIIKKGIINP